MWFKLKEKEKEDGFFTKTWMKKWFESINNSKEFKNKGKNWNAPLIIKFEPLPNLFQENKATGIFLNLKYGECTELRYSHKSDENHCDIIISGDEQTWTQLMESGQDPTSLILSNRLSLQKGSLVLLSTQIKAAKVLFKTAPTFSSTKDILKAKTRTHFTTTSAGLNEKSLPLTLIRNFTKSDAFISDDNFSNDRKDWKELNEVEQKFITHLLSLILGCKEAFTIYHLPLTQVIVDEGRIEEQMCMTSILWDETNHLKYLCDYIKKVLLIAPQKLEQFHGQHFKALLYNKLPQTISQLKAEPSPLSQVKASATLNIIIKSMIAKSCLSALHDSLNKKDVLPDLKKELSATIRDESTHQTFALYFIERLINENNNLDDSLEKKFNELLFDGTNIVQEIFTFYETETPLGIKKESLLSEAISEYQNCLSKIGIG